MKKRFLTAAAAALCAVSLAACGGSSTAITAAETQTSEAADTTAAEADAAEEETAAEAEETEEGGTLIMATNAEFPPYEYHDSSQTGPDGSDIVGIDAEIAGAIAEKLGKDLVIEDIAFDSLIPELQSGKADFVAAGMTVTEDTYATAVQSIIVTSDSEIAGPNDLAGKKIGVQQGITGDLYATDDFGDENIDRYPKGVDAVQALVQGKVDAVIIDNEPAKVFVGDNEGLKLLDTAYAEEEYAIAVKKGNTELLEQINTVIQELKDSGEMDSIIGKYITAE